MKFSIVCGSHRKESNSLKVSQFAEAFFKELGHDTYLLDLGQKPLDLWDPSVWEGSDKWKKHWTPVEKEFEASDGFILVTPEYSGMASPTLKNLILFCGGTTMRHKPGLIVSVSASRNGAYPVAELRMSSYKNSHLIYVPEHVIVREADDFGKDDNGYTETRLRYALDLMPLYAEAFEKVRRSGKLNAKEYGFGM